MKNLTRWTPLLTLLLQLGLMVKSLPRHEYGNDKCGRRGNNSGNEGWKILECHKGKFLLVARGIKKVRAKKTRETKVHYVTNMFSWRCENIFSTIAGTAQEFSSLQKTTHSCCLKIVRKSNRQWRVRLQFAEPVVSNKIVQCKICWEISSNRTSNGYSVDMYSLSLPNRDKLELVPVTFQKLMERFIVRCIETSIA